MTENKCGTRKVIGIFDGSNGSFMRAITEAQSNGLVPEGITLVGIDSSKLGQGSNTPLESKAEQDFLAGSIPWKGPFKIY